VNIYITWTDAEITAELQRLKNDHRSVITKWTAGDTSVEKEKSRVESQLRELNAEIGQRDTLVDLLQRTPETRAVASFR